MTFPVVQARTTSQQNISGTSHPVTLPTHSAGHLLVVFAFSSEDAPSQDNWTWPDGWTQLLTVDQFTVGCKLAESGSETLTLTYANSQRSVHSSYAISGAADPDGRLPEVEGIPIGTTSSPNPPSITPTGGAEDYLFLTSVVGEHGGVTVTGYPTNYVNGQQQQTDDSSVSGVTIGSAERQLNAASEDPGVFTFSSALQALAMTLAVHPPILLWTSVDDDPASPTDADWINNAGAV